MKNYLFALLCLLLPACLSAQSKRYKKKKRAKVAQVFVGTEYGVLSSDLVIEEDFEWKIFYADDKEWKRGFGQFYGLNAGYALTRNIDILGGFSIHKFSMIQTADFNFVRCDPGVYGAKGIEGAERVVYLNSWEIPIEARYKFKFKNLTLYPSLGFRMINYTHKAQEVNIFLDNGMVVDHFGNDKDLEHNRSGNFSSIFKLGIAYNVIERLKIKLEPFHRFNLGQDAILTEHEKTKLNSFGIMTGVEYALKMERK